MSSFFDSCSSNFFIILSNCFGFLTNYFFKKTSKNNNILQIKLKEKKNQKKKYF